MQWGTLKRTIGSECVTGNTGKTEIETQEPVQHDYLYVAPYKNIVLKASDTKQYRYILDLFIKLCFNRGLLILDMSPVLKEFSIMERVVKVPFWFCTMLSQSLLQTQRSAFPYSSGCHKEGKVWGSDLFMTGTCKRKMCSDRSTKENRRQHSVMLMPKIMRPVI